MKRIFLVFLTCFLFGIDEFFEPGVTIGGYGELHYNNVTIDDADATTKLDFHRFILFTNYNFTSEWSMKSELEIEHNMIDGDGDYDGEVELEQAYVNYHNASRNWGFGAGVVLISAGVINETHEPPTFLSVERPSYNSKIIPTTWFGNGAHIYAKLGDFHAKFVLHEDLNGEGMIDVAADNSISWKGGGIRSGRAKGYKSTAYSWTKNLSASYTGIKGLNIGGSYTINNAPIDKDKDNTVSVSLIEMHASYNANNITSVFEYGMLGLSHLELDNIDAKGYYFQSGYNVASLMDWDSCKIVPWFGMGMYDLDDASSAGEVNTIQLGLTWWPIDNIAWKIDYTMDKKDNVKTNSLNLGIGYMF